MADALTDANAVAAALLRPLTATEQTYIDALCVRVSGLLRTKLPQVDARIAKDAGEVGALDADVVSGVLAGVIKRYMVNVDGAAARSRTVGPYSESVSFASGGKALGGGGELAVTDDDLALLSPSTTGFTAPRTIRTCAPIAPAETCARW